MSKPEHQLSCADCSTRGCYHRQEKFPKFCLTTSLKAEEKSAVKDRYSQGEMHRVMQAAAEVEGKFYGKLTRVEETLKFASLLNVKKIGIACCTGLADEARIFTRIARTQGFEVVCVLCKVGSFDKTEMGIPEGVKLNPGEFEATCNPIMQAYILNREKTDLNVAIGLCVGHDAIFTRHSDSLVTTLIAKDRVLAHNPVAALYTSGSYYKKLFKEAVSENTRRT
ncbi:MAG: DUF1847 domain-containing protein [Peptococcaceae bacterium]|nr:DUF1847 domain-containing protein [Candidatus Syntrophopropionicum ammoniitolerans]